MINGPSGALSEVFGGKGKGEKGGKKRARLGNPIKSEETSLFIKRSSGD